MSALTIGINATVNLLIIASLALSMMRQGIACIFRMVCETAGLI